MRANFERVAYDLAASPPCVLRTTERHDRAARALLRLSVGREEELLHGANDEIAAGISNVGAIGRASRRAYASRSRSIKPPFVFWLQVSV